MGREELKPAVVIALGIVTIGFFLTGLSVVSMRMAYHRAYAEMASSCDRVSLVIVRGSKYFCAPVARVEMADPISDGRAPRPERIQSIDRRPAVPGPRL